MSYCLNPDCQNPQNPAKTKSCQSCGTRLLLAERYRSIKLIGAGGFGRTFIAEDEYKPSKPRCVVKQFYPSSQGTSNPDKAAELFQQEAVRLDELGKHPQIPELFAHFEQDNRLYIVQEFIDGQNLAQELAETGAFREAQIRSILSNLLPVLELIHKEKVIHRDLKPENIIRRRSDDRLVLVDFGAAKYANSAALAKTGTTIGSAGYAAPEQSFGKAVFASDIYSLGVTCIHLLTNMEPFNLYDPLESEFMWRDYLVDNPVSEELAGVLNKMIQSSVKQRYQSAIELMPALDLSAGASNGNSAVPTPPSPSPAKATPQPPVEIASPSTIPANVPKNITLSGHSDTVISVAFSPDGETLASGSGLWDKTIKLWDVRTGRENLILKGHSDGVRSVAFSPEGQIIASGSADKTIKLWDVHTGEELRTFKGHSDAVFSVAFSPNGQIIASGGGSIDKTIKLWDVHTGQELRTLIGHTDSIYFVAFSPDGQTLASGSGFWDKSIKLWDVATGWQKTSLKGHSDGVRSGAFSPDGQIIASAGSTGDKTIKLWDVSTGQVIRSLGGRRSGHSQWISSVTFSPDGQTLASSSGDKTLKLWDVGTGKELQTLKEHSDEIFSVAFSPDGQTLATGSKDKTIKIWQVPQ
ncbi:serine/threonine protein kinase [Trichocoleus sp. ST-U3]